MKKIMKPEEDAYGQEVWAYYNGKSSFEIVERDDGYIDMSSGVKVYFQVMKTGLLTKRRR